MTEKKFQEKVKETIAYEEKVYTEVKEFLKPYNQGLIEYGVEIVAFLWWFDKNDEENCDQFPRERVSIVRKELYFCDLVLLFKPIGASVNSDDGQEIVMAHTITEYDWVFLFYPTEIWQFQKHGVKNFLKRVVKEIECIKKFGFEEEIRKWS